MNLQNWPLIENHEEVQDIKDCNKTYKEFNDKFNKGNHIFIKAFHFFEMLMDSVDKPITPMKLADEALNTQFYYKVNDYMTLEYNLENCRLETYEEQIKDQYIIFFDLKPFTSEHIHMPYSCCIYNDDIQQEYIGINTCAVDMLNALPTDKKEILLIVHKSDYDCIFIFEYLQNVKPIITSDNFYIIKQLIITPNLTIILTL